MTDVLNHLLANVTQSSNQFLSGGLVLMVIGAAGVWLKGIPGRMWGFLKKHFTVVVDVQSSDRAYDWILCWLSKSDYGNKTRRLSVKHINKKSEGQTVVLIPNKGNHWFFHNGRPVWLTRKLEQVPGNEHSSHSEPKESISIRVLGRNRQVVIDLIKNAEKLHTELDNNRTALHMWDGWSSWRRQSITSRPIASVFLPNSAKFLVSDIKKFLANRDWYAKMGIPYRRGYLFKGLPGTGKSSIALALAGELGLNVYPINLGIMNDQQLEKAVLNIDKEETALILIEDIDTAIPKREGTEAKKLSLGTVLNVIDGLIASDNCIVIMTANNGDDLDPALKRKGRIDVELEFGHAEKDQIDAAIERFLPAITPEQREKVDTWPQPIVMAQVQEYLKEMSQ